MRFALCFKTEYSNFVKRAQSILVLLHRDWIYLTYKLKVIIHLSELAKL